MQIVDLEMSSKDTYTVNKALNVQREETKIGTELLTTFNQLALSTSSTLSL